MSELIDAPHNASSIHSFGRKGAASSETAREQIGTLVGSPPNRLFSTAAQLEANNTVLHHFRGDRVLVSSIEHPAVLDVLDGVQRIPVTAEGILDLDALEDLLKAEKTDLVSVMMVNNETGILQPVQEAAALAHRYGALFHTDAVQAVGRIPVSISEVGADFLTLSSHKIGGPLGAGALVLGMCGVTPTLLKGGGQEKFARAGTENVPAIAGFGAAAEDTLNNLEDFQNLTPFQTQIEEGLTQAGLTIYGQSVSRLANTTLFSMPGTPSETILMALDLEGIAVSNGSACTSGKVEPSYVLKAMGASDDHAKSAIRISTGWATTQADIDAFLHAWQKVMERLNPDPRQ